LEVINLTSYFLIFSPEVINLAVRAGGYEMIYSPTRDRPELVLLLGCEVRHRVDRDS
jgi:hypothetical protein